MQSCWCNIELGARVYYQPVKLVKQSPNLKLINVMIFSNLVPELGSLFE